MDETKGLTPEEVQFLADFEQYQKENAIRFYKASPKIEAFHKSTAMYRLLGGGNRCGKSYSCAVEDIWYALGCHPYKKVETPNDGWVVSKDYNAQKEGIQSIIMKLLPKSSIKDISNIKGEVIDTIWVIPDGQPRNIPKSDCSKITFKSCDSGVEKFGGAAKRWINFDEEPPRDIYQECIARIGAGVPLDIWLGMTPIWEASGNGRRVGMSWTYHELYKKADGKRIYTMSVGIDDNIYLTHEQKEEQKKKYHGVEYDIRIKGLFKLLSGNCVFDAQALQGYFDTVKDPTFKGFLKDNKLVADDYGELLTWAEKDPKKKYFIGADVGLGTGGDPSCAWVVDQDNNYVAELHGQIPPDVFGEALCNLGKYFNDAWIGVEANSFGIATINVMKGKYAKLYYRYQIDERSDHRTKKLGWWTDSKSKPLMISEFGQALRDKSVKIPSRYLVEECSTYVMDSMGTANAEIGCHDDRVIASMIALQVRKKHLTSGSDLSQPQDDYQANSTTGY